MKIIITIGTTPFEFKRVNKLIPILLKKKDINKIIFQNTINNFNIYIKKSCIKNKNLKIANNLTPKNLINCIKTADKIIAHGGPATIFLLTKYAKVMPLIIPRLAKYKEHVDDHQLHFVKFLRKKLPKKLKKYLVIKEDIKNAIENYLKEQKIKNQLKKFLFLNKRKNILIKKIINLLKISN
jgi:UDP-N-acetylglucosamine transferase subunit ALG13